MSYPVETTEAPVAAPAPELKEAPKKAAPAPAPAKKDGAAVPVKTNVFKTVAFNTAAPTYVAEPIVLYSRN